MENPCPCHSGKEYSACCEPFHKGAAQAQDPVQLMRSRYAAYALKLADYIMQTTHPENPQFGKNHDTWKQQILDFCYRTKFDGLEILDHKVKDNVAFVTFHAILRQRGQDASFLERSRFEKVGGAWLYHSGEVSLEK